MEPYEEKERRTEEQNNRKSGTGGLVLGLAVVGFFIADVIAMVYFANTNPLLCASCLGLLLLVFGIIGICSTKITWDTYPILAFPVIGGGLTVLPVVDFISKKNTGETFFTEHNILILVCTVFFIAGLLMMVMPFLKRYAMLAVCTESVTATCISHAMRISHGKHGVRHSYAPKWEYTFNGQVYQHQENLYTNVNVPAIGSDHEILINPDNPEQIYRNNPAVLGITLFVGICFAGVSVLAICTELF